MAMDTALIAGAEPWSSPGKGAAAKVGILVSHGYTGNPNSTRPLGEALAAHGHAVEVIRLPGHGTTVKDLVTTRYDDWRAEVQRATDDLASRCDTVVLVGLSMGGTLVLDVASANQDKVDGVVSINLPILDLSGAEAVTARLLPRLQRFVPTLPSKVAGIAENDIAKGGDEKGYDRFGVAGLASLIDNFPRIRAQLLDLKIPTVIAYSPQDHTVPAKNSKAALELVGSDDKVELVLERSYHVATLDHDAPLIEQAVLDLVAKVS